MESVFSNMRKVIDTAEYFGTASELKNRTEQILFQALLRVPLLDQKSKPVAPPVPFTPQAFIKAKR